MNRFGTKQRIRRRLQEEVPKDGSKSPPGLRRLNRTAPREPAVGVGSKGLLHPPLIQHLQWLSTLSLLAPISLPQVSATVHRPQTALHSQSQSAAEANQPAGAGRGQAGQLEAVILSPGSGSDAKAGPWVPLLLSLQMARDRAFCTSACHLVVRHRAERAQALDTDTNSRQL